MNRYVSLNCRCRSISRFITCACTETSSAETDSSEDHNDGRIQRQRAGEADRWRWPPLNSCG